jgi:hypothetical protein
MNDEMNAVLRRIAQLEQDILERRERIQRLLAMNRSTAAERESLLLLEGSLRFRRNQLDMMRRSAKAE